MDIHKTAQSVLFIVFIVCISSCDQISESFNGKENTKKAENPLKGLNAIESKYESFVVEPFDEKQLDQEGKGLRWYPDSGYNPDPPPGLIVNKDDTESGVTNLLLPFTIHVYESQKPSLIDFTYNLDKNDMTNWKSFHTLDNPNEEKYSLFVDFQDYKLFGFDYFLPPEILKISIKWPDEVMHEIYIDPQTQRKDIHIKGIQLEGIVSEGVSENRVLFLRNRSGLTWTVDIEYVDKRLNANVDDKSDGNKMIAFTLKTNITKILQVTTFMDLQSVKVSTPVESFEKIFAFTDFFPDDSQVGCLSMNFLDQVLSAKAVLESDFSSCYSEFEDFNAWRLNRMPELSTLNPLEDSQDDEETVIEPTITEE